MSTASDKELKEALIAVIQAWSMTDLSLGTILDTGTSLIEVEGASSESRKSDPLLEGDKLLEIYLQNYREKLSVYKPLISAVIDQPNFQPVSFLQLGLEKSYSVCRICRYYSKDTLENVLNNFKQRANKEKLDEILEKLSLCNPPKELKSIFLIPDNLFDKIFSQTTQNAIKRNFFNSIDCLEKNIDKILKLNPLPLGTGFLVGNSHLLTNHHVIPTPEFAQECVAQFGYEDEPTKLVKTLDYEFDSKLLFVTNQQLDYTLVQLQTDTYTKRPAGYNFGWLDLIESEENIAPRLDKDQVEKLINKLNNDDYSYTQETLEFYGLTKEQDLEGDRVAIIQHPRGRKKEIVLHNNEVTKLSLNNIDYKADTDYGSSGSPVFNINWKLVALTKGVIPKPNEQNNQQSQQSNDNRSNTQDSLFSWGASQGTRICRIVEDLKIKSFTYPKLRSFIEDFVFTSEQLNFPPLPSGLEFDGNRSYIDLNVVNLDTVDAITVEVWVQRHPASSGDGTIIYQPNVYYLYWSVGKLFLKLYDDNWVCTESECLNDGSWHHVAFTYNSKSEKNLIIYVDGEEKGNNSQKWDFFKNIINFKDNLYKVYIGRRKDDNNYVDYFQGFISEIRYWKVARDQEQIKQNMNRRLDVIKEQALLGYWRFEEGEGYKVYNLASRQPKVDSSLDTGLEFNGVSDYVDCGNDESLKFDKAITMESWFNLNGKPPQGFIINQGGSWGEPGYSLWFADKDTIRVELCDDNESQILFDTKHNCHGDLWHHIAFTWSMAPDSTQSFQMYIDGEQKPIKYSFITKYKNGITTEKEFPESNESIYQTKVDNSYFQNGVGKPKVNLNIGRAEKYGYYFNGSIGEVMLWNIALNKQQITDNSERRLDVAKEEGLLRYWRFEEVEGDKVYNLASKSKSSAVIKQTKIDFIRDAGLEFNGVSDYIDCGNNDKLKFDKAITIESCFKLNKEDQLGVVINQGGGWGQPGYSLWFYGENNIRVELCDEKGSYINCDTKHDCHKDKWHHLAFTWSMAPDSIHSIQMYIDGEKKQIEPPNFTKPSIQEENPKQDGKGYHIKLDKSCFENGIGKPKEINLNIGRAEKYTYYFDGSIAEVRLWDIARTEQQIKENMNCRLDAKEAGLVAYWKLDEEEGDKAKDSSNNAIVGNVYGAKWLKPYYLMQQDVFGVAFRTKRLTACQYPGLPLPWGLKFSNKQYYDWGNDDKFNTPKAITVEAWVKQTFGDCLIVNRVNGNGDLLRDSDTQAGYSLSWYEGKICVILSDGNYRNKTIVYSKNAPSDDMWHHIAFTWSYDLEQEQEGEIAIYIDGRYQDCIVEGKSNALIIQGQSKMTGIFTGVLDNLKTNLTIGKRENDENDTYRDFEIAEVRLWNVVRTQQQIQANMCRRLNSQSFQLNSETKGLVEEQNNLVGLVGYWRLDEVNAQDFLKKEEI